MRGESVAHIEGVKTLRQGVEALLRANAPFSVSAPCGAEDFLLPDMESARMRPAGHSHALNIEIAEADLTLNQRAPGSKCRPDILLKRGEEAILALEAAYTHRPEEGVRSWAKKENVPLIEYAISPGVPLDIQKPYLCHQICPFRECILCGAVVPLEEREQRYVVLHPLPLTCHACPNDIHAGIRWGVQIGLGKQSFMLLPASEITPWERATALQAGLSLSEWPHRFPHDTGAISCPHCGCHITLPPVEDASPYHAELRTKTAQDIRKFWGGLPPELVWVGGLCSRCMPSPPEL